MTLSKRIIKTDKKKDHLTFKKNTIKIIVAKCDNIKNSFKLIIHINLN